MKTTSPRWQGLVGLCVRAVLPCAILGGGAYAYSWLAVQLEPEEPPPVEQQIVRTKVVDIPPGDYPVVIRTYGVVQAHNAVTLVAEVAGAVTRVSPSFEAGAYFSAGEVLIEIDPRNYEATLSRVQSRLLAAKSALQLAQLNEQRKLRLVQSNAVSQADVQVATATREQAEAEVASAQAEVEQAQLDLARTKVAAPFDGRVRVKNVGLGQMAGPNTPLGEVFAVDFAEVRLPISGRQRQFLDLPEFADDEPLDVELRDGLNDSSPVRWRGRIVRTEGVLDENSRDLFAIARIADPFERLSHEPPLRIGQPVSASIQGRVLRDVVALPRSAVRQLNRVILVDKGERTLTPLEVDAIWSDDQHVVVERSAIPPNQWLATTHLPFAPAGSQVEIMPDADPEPALAESLPAAGSGPVAQ